MKTTQSFRIHFVVRAYKAKDGKAPLYVAVTVNKEKCLIGLKQNVDLKNWDADKGAPKGNRDQVREMTNYLEEVRLSLGNCYKELTMKGRLPTAAAVKNLYLGDDTAEGQTLAKLFAYHHETSQKALKWSTLKHYAV
ncbi:integrase-like protein [Mucilaginibacter yixingensis]|uniref:Integrase-like protein n=1 Tax=Mucilaginibacter yixingensis TaxID=1295612 RepID=A0A2T5J566_9SPHI|nr:Arm DNA-binding domain-containing protein [Mucilaginibacter yixingensis]PTQ92976.1 integrase-like protein [Mucilaginibacter yixingensis]